MNFETAVANDQLVSAVMKGIPDEALKRGIFTEEALIERFRKVRLKEVWEETKVIMIFGIGDVLIHSYGRLKKSQREWHWSQRRVEIFPYISCPGFKAFC